MTVAVILCYINKIEISWIIFQFSKWKRSHHNAGLQDLFSLIHFIWSSNITLNSNNQYGCSRFIMYELCWKKPWISLHTPMVDSIMVTARQLSWFLVHFLTDALNCCYHQTIKSNLPHYSFILHLHTVRWEINLFYICVLWRMDSANTNRCTPTSSAALWWPRCHKSWMMPQGEDQTMKQIT